MEETPFYDSFTLEPLEQAPPKYLYNENLPLIPAFRAICTIYGRKVCAKEPIDSALVCKIIGANYFIKNDIGIQQDYFRDKFMGVVDYIFIMSVVCPIVNHKLRLIRNISHAFYIFSIEYSVETEHAFLEVKEKGYKMDAFVATTDYMFVLDTIGNTHIYNAYYAKLYRIRPPHATFNSVALNTTEIEFTIRNYISNTYFLCREIKDLWRQRAYIDQRSRHYGAVQFIAECQAKYNIPNEIAAYILSFIKINN